MPVAATYRLQLDPSFGYADAAAAARAIADLGVTHLYLSPVFDARPGSTHGYDVINPTQLRDELGGDAAFGRLVAACRRAGLGIVVDIVPNHMAADVRNRWWRDVLEHGRASVHADAFDIDWEPAESRLRHKVVLPILGDHYGRELEAGRIRLDLEDGWFCLRCYDETTLPVAPGSVAGLVRQVAADTGDDDMHVLADGLAALAFAEGPVPPARRHARRRAARVLARQFRERTDVVGERAVRRVVDAVNADVDSLDALLDAQHHRLVRWQTSSHELVHRRFFDISDLVGVRQEEPSVFEATHSLVARWLEDGLIDGVRIDHVDGLRDPGGYLEQVRRIAGSAWVVVEKILEPGERLPSEWPVDGTTGYDFAGDALGVLVDPSCREPLLDLQRRLGVEGTWEEVATDAKRQVLQEVLGADVNRLADWFVRVCEQDRRHRDYTRYELQAALAESLVHLDVYRTYVTDRAGDTDRARIATAMKAAAAIRDDLDAELFSFLGRVLCGEVAGPEAVELRMRYQQLSGPAMAKGVEDTALYRWGPLVARNEVGSAPDPVAVDVDAFHERNLERLARHPAGMLTTSTHDTKRSEDVRARLAALSELSAEWRDDVLAWHEARPDGPGGFLEHLLYQTLVGAHPLDRERAAAYLTKVAREAKQHTSWTSPDDGYEQAVLRHLDALLADRSFTADLDRWSRRLLVPGRVAALAQKLLCLTSPGVPDLYQGSELWDLSLVDPDNRRPVDRALARRTVQRARRSDPSAVTASLARADDPGLAKALVVSATLAARRDDPEAFGPDGGYDPLLPRGPAADRVVAYGRGGRAVVVVPRLTIGTPAEDLARTTLRLPRGRWRDVFTGAELSGSPRLGELLGRFPVALLRRQAAA